jgi:hypothetical protein
MASRMTLSAITFLGGAPFVFRLQDATGLEWLGFAWFAVFAALHFLIFRCPNCRKIAVFTPGGWASPFVGSRCRYCGKDY